MSKELQALQTILADDTRRASLLANEELCNSILLNPELAATLEQAIIDDDVEQSENATDDASGILAGLAGIQPAVDATDATDAKAAKAAKAAAFKARMAAGKARKAKAAAKPKQQPESPTVFSYRVTHHKSGSVGAVVRGKHKNPSSNTTAVERVDDAGNVVDRFMLGTTQAAIISQLPPAELAKLAPRAKAPKTES